MEWRRREGEVERRAMAGNGFVSDGDKENQSTSSQEVTSRYLVWLLCHLLASQISIVRLWITHRLYLH
jgi:hypothetical protein